MMVGLVVATSFTLSSRAALKNSVASLESEIAVLTADKEQLRNNATERERAIAALQAQAKAQRDANTKLQEERDAAEAKYLAAIQREYARNAPADTKTGSAQPPASGPDDRGTGSTGSAGNSPKPPAGKPPIISGGQCTATTKKGTRCSRNARSGGRCWQHGG
jgi:hypothetical protein